MAKPFSRPTVKSSWKVLFVNVNEEDTSFLTRDVPIKVVHASSPSSAEAHLEQERYDALVMNMAGPEPRRIRQIKAAHDTAVFLLTDSADLSRAIEIVKQGADGFLLRGVSNPTSFIELTKSANRCSEPESSI